MVGAAVVGGAVGRGGSVVLPVVVENAVQSVSRFPIVIAGVSESVADASIVAGTRFDPAPPPAAGP